MLALLVIPLFYLGKRVSEYLGSVQEEHELRRKIMVLRAENEVLKNRITEYKRGNLIEAKARDELGMIKENEKIYLIIKK